MEKELQKDIDRIKAHLIKKLGWGTSDQWHSSMFAELSEKVFHATGVSLSLTTLKRFFGVIKYDGKPSISTLDALSKFLEFENWRAFKLDRKNQLPKFKNFISTKIVFGVSGLMATIILVLLISNNVPSNDISIPEGITFSSRILTNTYPNSVVFDFDLKDIASDNLKIQQYWDPTKTIDIHKNQTQATGIYYFPGYFRAKLLAEEHIITEHDLFLKSNGWLGTINYRPVPKYFQVETNADINLAYPEDIYDEISSSEQPLSISYHYVNNLGDVSGDNFHLKTSVRNTFNDKWAVCQTNSIYILGTEGALIIPFTALGCSSDINLYLNDVSFNGKENDLSAFGADISNKTLLEISNKGKEVSVFIENEKVYNVAYNDSIGKLVGIRFRFLGLGEVASFELFDQNDQKVDLF